MPSFVKEGSYGCVYRPAIKCPRDPSGTNDTQSRKCRDIPKTIGKVFADKRDFEKEYVIFTQFLQKIKKIKKADMFPDYCGTCEINASHSIPRSQHAACQKIKAVSGNPLFQIIMEDAGDSLANISSLENFTLPHFINALKDILHGIRILSEHGKAHLDIKPSNLVFDSSRQKLKVVDMGLMRDTASIFIRSNISLLSYPYAYYPPEFRFVATSFVSKSGDVQFRALDLPYQQAFRQLFSSRTTFFFFFLANILQISDDIIRPFLFSNREERIEKAFCFRLKGRQRIKQKYIAPFFSGTTVEKIDSYMLGISMLELLSKYILVHHDQTTHFRSWQKDSGFFTHYLIMVQHMIDPDPFERWNMDQVIAFYQDRFGYPSHLKQLTLPQLRDVAKQLNIKIKSGAKKKQIYDLVMDAITDAMSIKHPLRLPEIKACPEGQVRKFATGKCTNNKTIMKKNG